MTLAAAPESAEDRIRALQKASILFLSAQSEDQLAQALVDSAREAFSAVDAAVLFVNDDGTVRVAAGREFEQILLELLAARSPEDEQSEVNFVSVEDAENSPIVSDIAKKVLQKAGIHALTAVRLSDGESIRGALVCLFQHSRHFDSGTVELHEALARQSALVLSRIRLQNQLEALANYDRLTGLPNRNFLGQHLTRALEAAKKAHEPMALLFVDLDGFKPVNDRYGHRVGDEVLQTVSSRISQSVRAADFASRFGGDEFLIVCERITVSQTQAVGERLLGSIRAPFEALHGSERLSASVGACYFSAKDDDVPSPTNDSLVRLADAAMYDAKRQGGDRIVINIV